MSMSESASAPEPVDGEDTLEPVIRESEVEVGLQRSVRVGRVIVGSAIAGIIVAALLTLLFPVAENAEYTLGQVVGFMALIGGAIGLGAGTVIALVLVSVAQRQRGAGVAIQSDVR